MRVEFEDHPGSGRTIMFLEDRLQTITMTEHGEKDLGAALAQRAGMAKICGNESGEHTCSSRPDHTDDHVCRACAYRWQRRPE